MSTGINEVDVFINSQDRAEEFIFIEMTLHPEVVPVIIRLSIKLNETLRYEKSKSVENFYFSQIIITFFNCQRNIKNIFRFSCYLNYT